MGKNDLTRRAFLQASATAAVTVTAFPVIAATPTSAPSASATVATALNTAAEAHSAFYSPKVAEALSYLDDNFRRTRTCDTNGALVRIRNIMNDLFQNAHIYSDAMQSISAQEEADNIVEQARALFAKHAPEYTGERFNPEQQLQTYGAAYEAVRTRYGLSNNAIRFLIDDLPVTTKNGKPVWYRNLVAEGLGDRGLCRCIEFYDTRTPEKIVKQLCYSFRTEAYSTRLSYTGAEAAMKNGALETSEAIYQWMPEMIKTYFPSIYTELAQGEHPEIRDLLVSDHTGQIPDKTLNNAHFAELWRQILRGNDIY